MTREHALYRFFDADNNLLYIGISANPGNRFKQHRDDKPWWLDVTSIQLEPFPDRRSVLAAEREAIIREHPRYNVVHNRGKTGRTSSGMTCALCDTPLPFNRAYAVGIDPIVTCCIDCINGPSRHLLHDLAYPGCGKGWHDVWDHGLMVRGTVADIRTHLVAGLMPDDCHDICVKAGVGGFYFPYAWEGGLAHYQCRQGHEWMCGWTTYPAGRQLLNRGTDFRLAQEMGHIVNLEMHPEYLLP